MMYRMRSVAAILAVIALAAGRLPADDFPRATPAESGFDAARLGRIDLRLEESVKAGAIAGGAALVARSGKVVHVTTVGDRDREARRRIQADTIYRIASMTKPVTSVAAMQLVEDGRLRLEDPVSRYLPEFKGASVLSSDGTTVPAEREITIRHLLTHTSGITYRFFDRPALKGAYARAGIPDGLAETPGSVADTARLLAAQPLLFEPGTAWEYGLNTDVLGRVVEVAAGATLDEFCRRRIFEPLGMHDTHFNLPTGKHARLAALYQAEPTSGRITAAVGSDPVVLGALVFSATYPAHPDGTYFSGGAGLVSTIGDYWRFCQMLLERGALDGKRVLRPGTVDEMTRSQTGDLDVWISSHGDGFGYGFGVVTERTSETSVAPRGSYSWGGIFNTYFWIDPENELIGILMTQVYPNSHLTLRSDFQRLTYEALVDRN